MGEAIAHTGHPSKTMLHESTLMFLEDPAKVPRIPVEKKRITSSCSKMIKGMERIIPGTRRRGQ